MGIRRKNRDINIFSMSALDLFASSMGAFILITLITLPYYLKTDSSLMTMVQELRQKNSEMESQKQELEESLAQSQAEQEETKKKLEDAIKLALLGIVTKAESFTLVIDLSGSMREAKAGESMRHTVEQLIDPMSTKNRVTLIGFQGSLQQKDEELHFWPNNRAMVTMDDRGKKHVMQGVERFIALFNRGTPTLKALKSALKTPSEAIILISDGQPNSPWRNVINEVTRLNQGQKEIHTVAVGNYNANPELVEFLSTLSQENEGDFTAVSI